MPFSDHVLRATLAGLSLWFLGAGAVAQPICTQGVISINPLTIGTICSTNAAVERDLGVIARRNHLPSGGYGNVPEAQRPKEWPLGPASIQSCRFCLSPDRQNLTRLQKLR